FPEAGLAGRGGRRAGVVFQWALIAAIVVASAAAGYFVFDAFDDEVRRTARAAEIADAVRPMSSPTSLASLPNILSAMRLLDDFSDDSATTIGGHLLPGLSGHGRMTQAAREALDNLRRNALGPSLAAML